VYRARYYYVGMVTGMLECESLFGAVRGEEIHELVEEATAQACPCFQGRPCPIITGATPIPLTLLELE
jgi:hypothetical protein